jgi:uncharacterized protein YqfA (UPF0365 family)
MGRLPSSVIGRCPAVDAGWGRRASEVAVRNDVTWMFPVFLMIGLGLFAVMLVLFLAVARPWLRAKMTGGRVSVFDILGMQLRGSPPALLIEAYQTLLMQGVKVSIGQVERDYIANRERVATAGDLAQIVREGKRAV